MHYGIWYFLSTNKSAPELSDRAHLKFNILQKQIILWSPIELDLRVGPNYIVHGTCH